ncbi:lytic transglycosylase domain-containing protein [Paracraurococcus lichenis]|uniref:Lytic transglycosylase domain-containing protein n=1 Tax=Paracraurococcus lichenis TaxID=3064888 RepID=A0ABT9E203_9PROT|nr:lytic transglycosylase domain-containing protein [Paracraurococcus sp. LOR1-02]MDO9710178.1 lytic transglycosylase domain-containing protein [Paracraurococcus sp. LOR1-02]
MPQGKWTTVETGRMSPGRNARVLRPAVALSVLALLAACGQSTQTTAPGKHVAATYGHYNRPSSYDPPGSPSDPWGPYIREASRRFDVPERWIREVMRQESGGRIGATSPVGAMGLMQVMPGTYREMQGRYGLGDDPYHPYDSIMAGAAYIREMYDLYGSPAFLAAYNAGPRRLEDYLWNNRGLPNETRNYVRRIGPNIIAHHPNRRVAPEIYAAAEIPLDIPPGPRRMDTATMLALKEQREAQMPGIQVAQLPPGPVVRMDPIPNPPEDQVPERVQVAALGGGPVIRMDPIPDGSTYAAPPPREVVRMDPIPNPPEPAPEAAPRPAARPESPALAFAPPPRPAAPVLAARQPAAPARTQVALVAPPAAAAPTRAMPVVQSGPARGFALLGTAQAATLSAGIRPAVARGPAPAPAPAAWAVQVGAFASQAQARDAAASAQDVAGGRSAVQPVAAGKSTLYRARVTGLSQPAAQAACDRLKRKGACMVLSPDAQG